MKQLLQNMRDGKAQVVEVPVPQPRRGAALVQVASSLVSAGTERMVVEFAEKSLIGKAQSRPDLVRQVLDKARREGILTTVESAFNRLDQPMALGYSTAGTVVAVGEGLTGVQVGDRVACAGGGYAVHAEYNIVPRNLLTPIPENVDFESAAFTTLGAIALQGFRLAQPQLGDRVAVIGLGLLGLLTVGIAKAAGCRVFGIDLDPARVRLALQMGAEAAVSRPEAEDAGRTFTDGRGFDAVLICADTKSNDPIQLAGALAREHGQVVAVGAVGLEIPRKIYYEKELTVQVSRSYGPGRYDTTYEEQGHDYPFGYVRWTEGRNMAAFVELLASGRLDVHPLITHRFEIDQAAEAYDLITGKQHQPFLGVLISYPQTAQAPAQRVELAHPVGSAQPLKGEPGLGVLGAGNYATAVFLPIVQKVGGVQRVCIATASGVSARHAAQKYGFQSASSSESELLEDPGIQIIAILTRHQMHARQILAGLEHGKHVFCEKPLAITPAEVDEIEAVLAGTNETSPRLMVGFNRRFAPFSREVQRFFNGRSEPMAIHYRVNAGFLPVSHWTQDPQQGGGRIIGEGCHFIDYLTWLVGQPPVSVQAIGLPDGGRYHEDNVQLTFTFGDGSLGTLTYLANGDKAFPKERVEIFSGGRVAVLDDFRALELVRNGHRTGMQSRLSQDKGHRAGWEAFLDAVRGAKAPPIPYTELIAVTRASIAAVEALRSGNSQSIQAPTRKE
ncbi:predicted dehydrogenase [Longilinea arvoryzae]|uniref:Predicted dehydrogenase n=1 Tax=Longilinea arvoryzae TaxID=360412 RepID=A0A0S7BBX9_9CHLR|nr:bi-domain-containing oxidoreductase [Longilinea arvoryzae]GAP15239.1 predicted dehydrogenase [Longilinea arvoryzae]